MMVMIFVAFNWKERAALGLKKVQLNSPRDKNFPRSPHLYGDARTITNWLSEIPPEDQIIVEGPNKAGDEVIAAFYARMEKIHDDSQVQSEPKLSYNLLFGPNKAFGMIPSKKDWPRRQFPDKSIKNFRQSRLKNQ